MRIEPQQSAIKVWRIRLFFTCVLLEFIIALILKFNNIVFISATAFLSAVFLFMYLVYYTIRIKNHSAEIEAKLIIVTDGVINNKLYTIPKTSIQFIQIITSPLQKFFGVCTIFIKATGGTVYISGISKQNAECISEMLQL